MKFLAADSLYKQIRNFLKDSRQPCVTTFFDYYAFPTGETKGWDFVSKLKSADIFREAEDLASLIEEELKKRALEGVNLPNAHDRLIPYIQLHELESLYFAEPQKLADTFGRDSLAKLFQSIVEKSGGCEQINDSPQTAPSKRIEHAFPGYIKGRSDIAHGPRLADKLDLAIVRQKCPRFNAWVGKLEALGKTT